MADEVRHRKDREDDTTGPSRLPDTPYNSGHTDSMGFPDDGQGILDNAREQRRKEEPAPSVWHGDDLARRDDEGR